jgi:RES domain-containing protein
VALHVEGVATTGDAVVSTEETIASTEATIASTDATIASTDQDIVAVDEAAVSADDAVPSTWEAVPSTWEAGSSTEGAISPASVTAAFRHSCSVRRRDSTPRLEGKSSLARQPGGIIGGRPLGTGEKVVRLPRSNWG